jgi:hypothetical protein
MKGAIMPDSDKDLITENESNKFPEFKPGDKPFLKFGNEILNDNMPWLDMLNELLNSTELTPVQIASCLELSTNHLQKFVNGNECPISFKQGALFMSIYKNYRK